MTITIYYTGICSGNRQFFSSNSFYTLFAENNILQEIVYRARRTHYNQLSIRELCDITGAIILEPRI